MELAARMPGFSPCSGQGAGLEQGGLGAGTPGFSQLQEGSGVWGVGLGQEGLGAQTSGFYP